MVKYNTILKIVEKEYNKSYHNKPHLASLPYDRRSTDFNQLKERYNACTKEVNKRTDNINKLRKIRVDLESENEKDKKNI